MINNITCAFIGLGLIGGSIAKSLRAASLVKDNDFDVKIYATDKDNEAINLAIKERIVDGEFSKENLPYTDIIFLCAPVGANSENIVNIAKSLKDSGKDIIITDVGSVKKPIHESVIEAGISEFFIGGHPMAGSERFGYSNSSEILLQNAYYILTPEEGVAPDKIGIYKRLVELMGAIPVIVEPNEHDRVTAAISHLPHVIASALVNLVKNEDGKDHLMKTLAAGGFKDITRIASSSPDMWEHICVSNSDNILFMIDHFMNALNDIRSDIQDKKASSIHGFFDSARLYRDSFIDASYGPIKKACDIYINIADEPGVIAQISTTLAVHRINIKNLGIIHNRERAEGALRIELYRDEDVENARALLTAKGYEVVR